ncbi:piggyBac transposable element-derived protein 4-like [Branchiostoma floridae]|uniref:PiggyBac transposable element-derived protein 4-like n=1 Tax=Branchiostoma floridae TaxID=7739 RepID=A0A9J7HVJ9_BRAFL|nr:piggyBac transposable element-derived protein 4-like [Branchiostoma floridae]
MATRERLARYTAAEALRQILNAQSDDENSSVDEDESDLDVEDHLSDASDHSDTESVQEEDHPREEIRQEADRGLGRARGRGRGRARGLGARGRGRARGARGRGRGRGRAPINNPAVNQDAGNENPVVDRPYQGKNGTVWDQNPPPLGRRRNQDIIRNPPGITNAARCVDIQSAFSLFVTPAMIDLIVQQTNREARRKHREWNDNQENERQEEWCRVDGTEIRAVIGLCIIAGLYQSNHEPQASLWSTADGKPVFPATMTRERFRNILKYMRFDDRETRAERRATDKLAAFRDIWEMFIAQLPKYYIPGTDLCVDEQLVAFRGRCAFRQYIPSKPAKYGLKIWWNCDATTCYPLKGEVYLGRQPGEQREIGQGARVVKELTYLWRRTGRNVTADNFFTSIPLAEDLWEDGLTYVGTIRSNKPHIPEVMKAANHKEVNSSMFGFQDQLTLTSYVPSKGKAVLVLSSMHHDANIIGEQQKPEIIMHYNATKSGVDNLDHLATMHTCRRKINRWPMVLFFNLLDVAGIASLIVFLGNFPDWNLSACSRRRRLFLRELGYNLVMPHVQRRAQSPYLMPATRESMARIGVRSVRRAEEPAAAAAQEGRKRCELCPRSSDRKVRRACAGCGRTVCAEHSYKQYVCGDCL